MLDSVPSAHYIASTMKQPSSQREYQLRHKAQGLCVKCAEPAILGRVLCEKHMKKNRAHNRRIVRELRELRERVKQLEEET